MPDHLQIIWTPWRNHSELLSVRECFYAPSASNEQPDPKLRRKACDQVSAWKLRGNLPHAVELTWLLTEAVLVDENEKLVEQIPIFAIKASYITALTRFVTGLLDAQQDSKYKVSMYTQAQKIGLPALFVDLRHEATHGDMPHLKDLRRAAKRGLEWLWGDYWMGIEGQASMKGLVKVAEEEEIRYHREKLHGGEEEEELQEQPGGWQKWQGRWTPKPIGTI